MKKEKVSKKLFTDFKLSDYISGNSFYSLLKETSVLGFLYPFKDFMGVADKRV